MNQFSRLTLPSGLAMGDGLLFKCFLRSTGVSPLVSRLSTGRSTIPCVGWAVAFPYITFRSYLAISSVQGHPRDEILTTWRMILDS